MTIQYSVALRNAQLDTIESHVGVSAKMRIYTGSPPADADTAATGTLLVELNLPSDWMAAASSGTKAKQGTWSGTGLAAAGSGTAAGYFRILDTTATTTSMQGTITGAGGGGDMELVNTSIAENQTVTVDTFTITAGNP